MGYQHTTSRGQAYTLHRRVVKVQGTERTLHFFSLKAGPDVIDDLPPATSSSNSPRTGLPLLKRQG